MYSAAENLKLLRNELGEQAHLLQHPPLNQVRTAKLSIHEDPLAVSFKIAFGYIEEKNGLPGGDRQQVWIKLYPAAKPGARAEIQFHTYDTKGAYVCRQDSESIGNDASGYTRAFRLPNKSRWIKSKLQALAKYYFLVKLAEIGDAVDAKKSQFGIAVGKTFKDDLKAVCREFEAREDLNTTNAGEPSNNGSLRTHESELTDAHVGFTEGLEMKSIEVAAASAAIITEAARSSDVSNCQ
jgi:hypothetical protein